MCLTFGDSPEGLLVGMSVGWGSRQRCAPRPRGLAALPTGTAIRCRIAPRQLGGQRPADTNTACERRTHATWVTRSRKEGLHDRRGRANPQRTTTPHRDHLSDPGCGARAVDGTRLPLGEHRRCRGAAQSASPRSTDAGPTGNNSWSRCSQRFVPPGEVADLGSFRDEVAAFLRERADLYGNAGIRRILASAVAASSEDEDFHRAIQPFLDRFPAGMRTIIQRGIARGDVRADVDIGAAHRDDQRLVLLPQHHRTQGPRPPRRGLRRRPRQHRRRATDAGLAGRIDSSDARTPDLAPPFATRPPRPVGRTLIGTSADRGS